MYLVQIMLMTILVVIKPHGNQYWCSFGQSYPVKVNFQKIPLKFDQNCYFFHYFDIPIIYKPHTIT